MCKILYKKFLCKIHHVIFLVVHKFYGHVTGDIIYQEFVKMDMQDFISNDLSKRYYRNEITYKDFEYLESNFNLKLEMLERGLKPEIVSVSNEVFLVRRAIEINKIELKQDIFKTIAIRKAIDSGLKIVKEAMKINANDTSYKSWSEHP
ncbi:Bdr family repetitive protein (plasmid) [Borrelia hermsii]